jgi:hypothetical protein
MVNDWIIIVPNNVNGGGLIGGYLLQKMWS